MFRFLLCDIGIYGKHAWIITLKDKKGTIITNAFQKTSDELNIRPHEIWVNKGNEFYNRSMKLFWKNNYVKMYSTHNEGKSVVT